ncbi:extracellular solute-binding protein [Treponema sp. OttesenSCG-928-L16]|nr:extracellular solute-binding protein [Treponema sp. OttesenSCG-928-L16]
MKTLIYFTNRYPLLSAAVFFCLVLLLCSCVPREEGTVNIDELFPERPQEMQTLKLVTITGTGIQALYEVADRFSQAYPSFNVEISAITNESNFTAFLASKFAGGDAPDIIIYHSGTYVGYYARGGHLLDLSGAGFEDRFMPGTESYCRYDGRLYALPLDIGLSGVFVQMSVLWRAGIRQLPKTLDEFIGACGQLRRAGIEYPVVIAAADDSGAAAFNFQYLYQNIYQNDRNLYEHMLKGERHWTDPPFAEMYRDYDRIRVYANPDAVRVGIMEAVKRFADGEAAFYFGGTSQIADIRRLKPDIDMLLIPPPLGKDESWEIIPQGVNLVVSASSATRYPEAVTAFLQELCSPEGADIYAQALSSLSPVIGSMARYDKCVDGQAEALAAMPGKTIDFMSREWLPDFKKIFKRLNQQWFLGREAEDLLEELETYHQQLIRDFGAGL